jgi:hypothetical protein
MTPVIVALYDDYGIATRVRTQLVADGFVTDRVEVTSRLEAGQTDAEPGDAFGERVANYFHTIFDQNQEQARGRRVRRARAQRRLGRHRAPARGL